MHVLTRKGGQAIVIGGQIRVTILAVSGNRVRLGITAPSGLQVNREEIHKRLYELAAQR
jgi:carbon storage regulator